MTPKRPLASRFTGLLALFLVLCAVAFFGAPPASAAPVGEDPVTRLLAEQGLFDAPSRGDLSNGERGLMQHMRDTASDMVMTAMGFLGVPYRRGGDSADEGFDCSGFTRHIFEKSLGLILPRRADEQASAAQLVAVPRDQLKPGDLVFFNTLRRTFSHVGIYVGEGKFIHSPRSGATVRVEDMRAAYWTKRYTGARRPDKAGNDYSAQVGRLPNGSFAGQADELQTR